MGDAGEPRPKRLRIIIVGAGIGGLAAAVALSVHHDVTVFEATKELVTAGAGIQIPPPSIRILRLWGIEDSIKAVAVSPRGFTLRNFEDGRVLGSVPTNPLSEQRYGYPWWTLHRADYQRALFDAAKERGVSIHLDHRVVDLDTTRPAVTIRHGDELAEYEADLVVGADGLRSQMRSIILGDKDPGLRPSNICAYRALIPMEDMNSDHQRAPLMDPNMPNVDVWLGGGHLLLSYPVRQGHQAQYNMVLVHPEKDEHTTHNLPPRFPRPSFVSEVSAHYEHFCPQVRSLVSVIAPEDASDYFIAQSGLAQKDGILEWKFAELDTLPSWTSPQKTCLLIGDAAHAQKPYMSAGASGAVEDAAGLAAFLQPEYLTKYSLETLVDEFVKIRKPRAERYQTISAEDAITWGLPEGWKRDRRDELLKCMDSEDRQVCADAAAKMRDEGVGSFNFGDSEIMDWAWGYDVVADANETVEKMSQCS